MSPFRFSPFDAQEFGIAYKILGFSIVLSLFLWIGVVVCSDKTPKNYYLEQQPSPNPSGNTCVYANEKWTEDPTVFCGDVSTAWQIMMHLNQSTGQQIKSKPAPQEPEATESNF